MKSIIFLIRLPTLLGPDFRGKKVFFSFSTNQVMATADTSARKIAQLVLLFSYLHAFNNECGKNQHELRLVNDNLSIILCL